MESANPATTFYKAHDHALLSTALLTATSWLSLTLAGHLALAVICFVGFDNLSWPAKRSSVASFFDHGLTDAVRHKPSCTVAANAKGTHKLVSRYAFLRRCHEIEAQGPFVKRDMAAFHDRANRHSELLTALAALIEASAVLLAGELHNLILVGIAAMGAIWTVRPADRFKVFAGLVCVLKNGVCKVRYGHILSLIGIWTHEHELSSA